MLQAFSCDGVTGMQVDRFPASSFTWERRLSAAGEATVTVPLDGTFTKTQLRQRFEPWSRILVLERDGVPEYAGYITNRGYTMGSSSLTLKCGDLWSLLHRRGAWDHTAPNVEKWKQTVTGSLAQQASAAVLRGRTGPADPPMGMPVTLPGFGGTSVTRTYYGYHMQTVGEVLDDLMDEGLDVYFKPRWIVNGDVDWEMQAGVDWVSPDAGTRDLYVTAKGSPVMGFSEDGDASRITNNARWAGEGSEVDMLVRSNRNAASSYPLLDRVSEKKDVTDTGQLTALANRDLAMYGQPTSSWSFDVQAGTPLDVGSTVRLHFDGDPWIADGFHERRVVGVSGDMSDRVKITVQPTGGA